MRLFAPDEIPWEEVRTQQHVAAAQLTGDCAGCSASVSHEMLTGSCFACRLPSAP